MKFIIFILSLATVTELVQLWVPQRTFNIYDWVANVVGLIVGMGVIRMARRREGKTALGLLVKDPHLH
jgi:VanZ family protein